MLIVPIGASYADDRTRDCSERIQEIYVHGTCWCYPIQILKVELEILLILSTWILQLSKSYLLSSEQVICQYK